jgi:hypothetical protein
MRSLLTENHGWLFAVMEMEGFLSVRSSSATTCSA